MHPALHPGVKCRVLLLLVERGRDLQRDVVPCGRRVGREDRFAADVGGLRVGVVGDALRPRTRLARRRRPLVNPVRPYRAVGRTCPTRRESTTRRERKNDCREGRC